ncbi:hypothetical protein SAY87_013295 [Trapa incisa]|uniref:Uncharacterized protein n=1 Tax=Trapa incisa TaxID=236973 RepID=A0AAN7KD42_9MYRT|nr:hypothetical protein SAY87_013295 [Trapa incisa]
MIPHKQIANAVVGKTFRACDNCIRKRARWYCAADDAFLCHPCDASVHTANPLARRHERVQLVTSSLRNPNGLPEKKMEYSAPSWHRGFTKKARTPRHAKHVKPGRNPMPLVPEFCGDETSNEEINEEQLLYQVPAYDPFASDICSFNQPRNRSEASDSNDGRKTIRASCGVDNERFQRLIPSDKELAEFAADVESLLGKGLESESFGMEGLGLMNCDKERENSLAFDCSLGGENPVKFEEEGAILEVHMVGEDDDRVEEIDISKETFELNFDDYDDSPMTCVEEEDQKVVKPEMTDTNVENVQQEKDGSCKRLRTIFLKLDYESIITAWASQGSPWTSGDRPSLSSDDYWPNYLGIYGEVPSHYGRLVVGGGGGGGGYGGHMGMTDAAGREAKVSRYREKRRTRLFSKKIRYEVRKLNAEKRPRMKGRFVKRPASFSAPTSFHLHKK